MNDEFEKQIQRTPLREVPAQWRGKILDACRRSAQEKSEHEVERDFPLTMENCLIEPLNRAAVSPSPFNGERAGVRGESVRLASGRFFSWWRELLWPCPQAWAGLAAVWVVIIGLHLMAGAEPGGTVRVTAIAASPELLAVLAEQRQLVNELLPAPEPPPSRRRTDPADRPRSQRHWQPELPTSQLQRQGERAEFLAAVGAKRTASPLTPALSPLRGEGEGWQIL